MEEHAIDLKVPIVFSVTGHRDITKKHAEQLKGHLVDYFKKFKSTYKNTNLILLSALAEGGDRIAAEAAIESKAVELVTVLPMDASRYIGTFTDADAENGFRELMENAINKADPIIIPQSGEGGDVEQYRALGRHLVSNSHILLALWDGSMGGPDGGTSDVARMGYLGADWGHAEKTNYEEKTSTNYLDIVDICLVYHVTTLRKADGNGMIEGRYIAPVDVPGDISADVDVYPETSDIIPERYSNILKKIDTINSDMALRNNYRSIEDGNDIRPIEAGITEDLNNGKRFYILPEEDSILSDKAMECCKIREMMGRFALADRLAMKYQRKSFVVKNVYLLTVMFASLFLMMYLIMSEHMLLITAYVVLITASMLMYWYAVKRRKREYHMKFLRYRQLAEMMRVHFYWKIAGIMNPVSDIFPEYLRESTEWVRSVLKGWTQCFSSPSAAPDLTSEMKFMLLRDAWVKDQQKYHHKKKDRNGKAMRIWGSASKIMMYMSIAASLAVLAIGMLSDDTSMKMAGIAVASIILLLNIIVSVTNILSNTVETVQKSHIHGGTPEEIDLKERMFKVADTRLGRILEQCNEEGMTEASAEACRQIFYELGIMSIEECSDWASTHVAKDISSPTPGKT